MATFSVNKYRLFIVTLFTFISINSFSLSFFKINPKAIAREKSTESKLIAKSSGGRSGGGSFKKRSSGSSSPRRSSPRKSSPRPTYNSRPRTRTRTSSPSRSYSSPSYRHNYTYHSGSSSNGFIFALLLFLIFGGVTFAVVAIVFKSIFASNSSAKPSDRERDNNIVTLSKLQVALSAEAKDVQKQLSELSLGIDTNTDEGLLELLRESVLVLLRNSAHWSHVLSSSESLHIDKAESAFQKLSVAERSQFSAETLSNFEGKIRQREAIQPGENDVAAYIVVTLIIGTADDKPLFAKIHSQEELQSALEKLASIRDDYLMKFELLWSPQTAEDSMTYEELITEYTDMIQLF